MNIKYSAIERLSSELSERLARLETLSTKTRQEFDEDPFLKDIVERNLEVAAQCVLDICHRIISIENSRKPESYYEAILILGELDVIDPEFAHQLAPLAGFRNILVHAYATIDWDIVYDHLHTIEDLKRFRTAVLRWINKV
jgi:uncharacterized protein YutE (UPF0331/DUF86 family)